MEDFRVTPTNVVCIGPTPAGSVSGQAMLFQLSVDALTETGNKIKVFDIAGSGSADGTSRPSGGFGLRRALDYLMLLPKIWKYLIIHRSTVYLTTAQSLWGFLRDAAVIWPAFFLGCTIVAHQLGANYGSFYKELGFVPRFAIRATLARVDALIVEGELVKEQFSFLPGWQRKVWVVPNGLPQRVAPLPASPKTIDPAKPLHVLYLSNMLETKGYWDVLEAVRILVKERRRNIRCCFAGRFLAAQDSVRFLNPATAEKEFRLFIEQNNLSELVSYAGCLVGEPKIQALKTAHVFVLPSNYINEGQPVAILEAMAYGLVVIATQYRLIPSMVIDGNTGFFVNYGHPEEIASHIEYLIEHPEVYERMSRNGMQRFVEGFSADSYVSRVTQVLRSVDRYTDAW